jgi:hypothetical protein
MADLIFIEAIFIASQLIIIKLSMNSNQNQSFKYDKFECSHKIWLKCRALESD